MNVLIIDNDANIREGLKEMLTQYCSGIQSVAEAHSVASGFQSIQQFQPNLVFLDVEMDDGTGFDLIKKLGSYHFQLIFITAYNKYAVDAFRLSAIDFLQKPIDPQELVESVTKAKNSIRNLNLQKQLQVLHESMNAIRTNEKKIVLKDNEAIHFVRVQDIIRCEADGAYTKFHIVHSSPLLISKSLKEYDELLSPFGFIRCHHSHLVNISKILKFDKTDGGYLILDNKDLIPVSQRKKDQVLDFLST
jgi:two-component system LytT family response regulator